MKNVKQVSRREFLRLAASLGISLTVAEGLMQLRASEVEGASGARAAHGRRSAGTSPYHWAMVIDLAACTGCNYCTYACKATNDTPGDINWNVVLDNETSYSRQVYLPRPCMHCENAPCVDVCPVGATYHRPDGLVAMDYGKCIGCRYCQVACPYGARYFNWAAGTQPNPMVPRWGHAEVEQRPRGVVEKCTFCAHRIDAGLERGLTPGQDREATPACVNICPADARFFGDLNDPDSAISTLLAGREAVRLRAELGTNPRVYYLLPQKG
jgi:Fe-S-cluster-containing dehydrogenase component